MITVSNFTKIADCYPSQFILIFSSLDKKIKIMISFLSFALIKLTINKLETLIID
jgi:hypothetical protein